MRSVQYLAAVAALAAPVFAQTFTDCDPTKRTGCPVDPALGKSVAYDFTKGAPSDFTAAAGTPPVFNSQGGVFSIAKSGQAPTLSSNWYIMFGHVKVVMKQAPGQGIVSSLVLESNDLDEVDWEWVGSEGNIVQTNYFGKGNTTLYNRGANFQIPASSDGFNTYELDWTSEHLQWIINGNVVRTLTPATANDNQYPQTPMQLKIGNWAAGDSTNAGTRSWAGGAVDYSQAPFNMIVKSVEVTDYSTGKSYSYGDMSGDWESIVSDGGKINAQGGVPDTVSTASASGTTLTASATGGGFSAAPQTLTTAVPTGQFGTSTGTVSLFSTVNPSSSDSTSTSSASASVSTVSSGSDTSTSSSTTSTSLTTSTFTSSTLTTIGLWNTTYTSTQGVAAVTGTGNATVGMVPTTTGTAGSGSRTTSPAPGTGAGSMTKPALGLIAAGLLAVMAL